MSERADVIVVGMGPGGEDAAERLAEAGLDVVGVEAGWSGGECPYWGCVPSKMMIRAANLLAEARRVPGMAGTATVRPDWAPVARRIRDEATDNWDDKVAVKRFEDKGGRFVRGWGRLEGPKRVVVGETGHRGRTGGGHRHRDAGPRYPRSAGLAGTPYWTNRQAIEGEEVPESLTVLGGGAVGVELAQVFPASVPRSRLEAGRQLVGPEEPEAGSLLAEVFGSEGIDVRTGVEIESVHHDGHRFAVSLGAGEPIVADRLLVATGRRPDLAQLNAASIGLVQSARALPVDDHMRVAGVDGVWALGDAVGHGAFTHVSMYQADIVVNDILGHLVVPADYRAVPRVTFTDPEIGSVGMSERDARRAGIEVRVGSAPLPESTRGWIHKVGNRGFIKLVEDSERGVLVGATSVGPTGGEVLGLLTLAVHAAVPTTDLRHMIYAYPTFHRAVETAVKDLLGG